MAWENSNRKSRLPANWKALRLEILRRDGYKCQEVTPSGFLCLDYANEVDHIIAGDNHSKSNLRAICSWHHKKKSSEEGRQAREAKRLERMKQEKNDHPGMKLKGERK